MLLPHDRTPHPRVKQDTSEQLVYTGIPGKKVTAEFEDVAMSSDGGILLAAEVERQLGIVDRLAECIRDERQPGKVLHGVRSMLRQRILQIVAGYEDANDCDHLGGDPVFKTAVGCDRVRAVFGYLVSTICGSGLDKNADSVPVIGPPFRGTSD